ncbi:hypothetical protein I5E15_18630 [Providencia stuartii]|uniref:MrpH family fimbial adhesin n=1 Tax=Providencia stuartii TaxID=588 RepID=UPI000D9A811B|nr:hypothetical protein [Providencia stuartii]MBG5898546.1 hypothetical protein [Providencia stuartii]MTC65608.1 hypothetical protein [Providencia stuartii]SPY69303.1 Uncharacterised protein [Providencia stuartii]
MKYLFYYLFYPLLILISIHKSFAGAQVAVTDVGTGRYPPVTMDIISWTEDDSDLNPCYNAEQCWIGPDVLYSDGPPSLSGSCLDFHNCIEISSYRYASEVRDKYQEVFGIPHSSTYFIDSDDYTCVGLFYIPHAPIPGMRDAMLWPNSTCGNIPPINLQCEFIIPPEIDHGSLKARDLNGNTSAIYGTAYCNNSADFRLYITSSTGQKDVQLTPSGSLLSRVTVNDQAGWQGIPISLGPEEVTFKVESTLITNGDVDAGSYSGDVILTLSYQ